MAGLLEHRETALFAGIQAPGASSMPERNRNGGIGKVESKRRFPLSHTPDCGGESDYSLSAALN